MTSNEYFGRLSYVLQSDILHYDQNELFDLDDPKEQIYKLKSTFDCFEFSLRMWAVDGSSKQRWFRLRVYDTISKLTVESKSFQVGTVTIDLVQSLLSNMVVNESCVFLEDFMPIGDGTYLASTVSKDKKVVSLTESINGFTVTRSFDFCNTHLLIEYLRYRSTCPLLSGGAVDFTSMKIAERQRALFEETRQDLLGLFKHSNEYTVELLPDERNFLKIKFNDSRKYALIGPVYYTIEGHLSGDQLIHAGTMINIVHENCDDFVRFKTLSKSVPTLYSTHETVTDDERLLVKQRIDDIRSGMRASTNDVIAFDLRTFMLDNRAYDRQLVVSNITSKSNVLTIRIKLAIRIGDDSLFMNEVNTKLHWSNDQYDIVKLCSLV